MFLMIFSNKYKLFITRDICFSNNIFIALTVTSARFIARSALVEWSQLRLFKAKEGRSYLQGSVCT